MTKIALIAATEAEIAPLVSVFGDRFAYKVTGIGPVAAAIGTAELIAQEKPNLVVNIGIAGAIDPSLALCQAVLVCRDYMADVGAWRAERFEHFTTEIIEWPYVTEGFANVQARTVSGACAHYIVDESQIESMEGAAVMGMAKRLGVRVMQLRILSNYVGQPRAEWRISDAIAALPDALGRLLP